MRVNLARGLFRLWLILTIPWLILGAYLGHDTYSQTPYIHGSFAYVSDNESLNSITASVDFEYDKAVKSGKISVMEVEHHGRGIVTVYHKHDVDQQQLEAAVASFLKRRTDSHDERTWEALKFGAAVFLGAPMAILAFGAMALWAIRGFKG